MSKNEAKAEAKNPPVAKVRVKTVQGSIWARTTEQGTFFDASFQRGYTDRDGNWKNTHSFDLNGLLALQHAVGLAIDKILELQKQDVADRPEADDEFPT